MLSSPPESGNCPSGLSLSTICGRIPARTALASLPLTPACPANLAILSSPSQEDTPSDRPPDCSAPTISPRPPPGPSLELRKLIADLAISGLSAVNSATLPISSGFLVRASRTPICSSPYILTGGVWLLPAPGSNAGSGKVEYSGASCYPGSVTIEDIVLAFLYFVPGDGGTASSQESTTGKYS